MTSGGKIALGVAIVAAVVLGGGGAAIVATTQKGRCGLMPPAPSPAISAVAQAIADAENSPSSWNNPGSLTYAFGFPTLGAANRAGVLLFQNCVDGWNALYKQLSAIVSGSSRYSLTDSLATFGMGYSGGDPNWAVNVAASLGVSPDVPLGAVLTPGVSV